MYTGPLPHDPSRPTVEMTPSERARVRDSYRGARDALRRARWHFETAQARLDEGRPDLAEGWAALGVAALVWGLYERSWARRDRRAYTGRGDFEAVGAWT